MAGKKESIKKLNKQYSREKKKMLSYARWDNRKRRKKYHKKKGEDKSIRLGIMSATSPKDKKKPEFNPMRQGEKISEKIRRLISGTIRRKNGKL